MACAVCFLFVAGCSALSPVLEGAGNVPSANDPSSRNLLCPLCRSPKPSPKAPIERVKLKPAANTPYQQGPYVQRMVTNLVAKKLAERKYLIAYFRHSIKATGAPALGALQAPQSALVQACGADAKSSDCQHHMWGEFEAYDGHLTGHGREECPRNVGIMLRTWFQIPKPSYALWSGSYPRVMGTGIQTAAGFAGDHFIKQIDMPKTTDQAAQWTKNDDPNSDEASIFLAGKMSNVAHGQRTGWLKEYLHDYNKKECGTWDEGESGGCELSVYAPGLDKPQLPGDCIGFPSKRDALIKTWSDPMQDLYARTDSELIRGLIAIEKSDKFGFVKRYDRECPNFSYEYASNVCKLGQHFFNERTSGIPGGDYREIIPSCGEASPADGCDEVVDMLNDLCWPFFAKSHLVGHANNFVDNSMALLLGTFTARVRVFAGMPPDQEEVSQEYLTKTYEKMRINAKAVQHGLSIGEGSDMLQDGDEGNPADAILMSSHDATTNGMRLLMIDAGLIPHAITHWSDGSPMQFQDELAYQVMLTFTIEGDQLEVRNLAQPLGKTREGCKDLKFDDKVMQSLGKWPVRDFMKKMTDTLRLRNPAGRGLVDPSVDAFLERLHSAFLK